ncbi:glycoside hydrolase/deacetylase [Hortaea werneckii]|nr:glycoside hydrolase/deacetylase [Hortaea werneckii]
MLKRILCSYGVDLDAVAGWLGSYGVEESPSDISRGLFAGKHGTRRMLRLPFEKNVQWCAMLATRLACTVTHMKTQRTMTIELLTKFCGKSPRGSVAPWWETSQEGVDLLLNSGVEYDHSMSHDDCHMYWLRTGDKWTKIDYAQKAETWMKPLEKGSETSLVEIPANCELHTTAPSRALRIGPRLGKSADVEDLWRDHFDYFYREMADDPNEICVFPITVHPDVSGRPHVLLMHERLIEYINSHEGVEWVTMEQMCDEFKTQRASSSSAQATQT